jgi:hypothetical protein
MTAGSIDERLNRIRINRPAIYPLMSHHLLAIFKIENMPVKQGLFATAGCPDFVNLLRQVIKFHRRSL